MAANHDLAKASERARQNRAARVSEALTDAAPRSVLTVTQDGAFSAGDRVLDIASGQLGTVTAAGPLDKMLKGDVRVTLDDGRTVIRGVFGLLFRPEGGRE